MSGALRKYRATVVAAVVVALVVLAALIAVQPWRGGGEASSLRALVHDSEGAVHELPLGEDAQIVVTTAKGTNTVAVEGGAVRVTEADCANHDCMRQGPLSQPGGQIICLPHELWIEVVEAGDAGGQMDVDAVNGGGFDTMSR